LLARRVDYLIPLSFEPLAIGDFKGLLYIIAGLEEDGHWQQHYVRRGHVVHATSEHAVECERL